MRATLGKVRGSLSAGPTVGGSGGKAETLPLMKIEDVLARLRQLGLRKTFRPRIEPESGTILLKVRRPARVVGGRLQGSEIDLYDASTFRVWTEHKKKARALAQRFGLEIRLLDGEAELFVPAALADAILPAFGAKTKRELTPEQVEALKSRLNNPRNGPNLKKNALRNEVPAIAEPGVGS